MTKKVWPTPVQSKVAAAVIVAVLAGGYFIGLWSLVREWLTVFWYLLAASTLVPNWLLGLFAICTIIVAGMLGTSLRPTRQGRPPPGDRTQANFFNIKWRWSYDAAGAIQNLTPYCLHCDHQIVLKNVGGDHPTDRYECRCDHCGTLACEVDCSVQEFERRVLRRIHEAASG